MQIVHALIGLVRSPVGTTAAQVFSRVMLVWGVIYAAPDVKVCGIVMICRIDDVQSSLLHCRDSVNTCHDDAESVIFKQALQENWQPYVMMVTAWSVTEVIRYSFYAFGLLGSIPHVLTWCRFAFIRTSRTQSCS